MDGVGGLKKKQAGVGSDHIYYYPKHHTAVPTSYLNVCKETKKEAHKQCAEEVQAFGIRL